MASVTWGELVETVLEPRGYASFLSAVKLREGAAPVLVCAAEICLRFAPFPRNPLYPRRRCETTDTRRVSRETRFFSREASAGAEAPRGWWQGLPGARRFLAPRPRLAWDIGGAHSWLQAIGGAHSWLQAGIRILAVTSVRGEATGADTVLLAFRRRSVP